MARHCAPDTTCEADDFAPAVAYAADAVQRAWQACAVVPSEVAQLRSGSLQLLIRDLRFTQLLTPGPLQEAGLWAPSQVEHYFEQRAALGGRLEAPPHVGGQHLQACVPWDVA